MIKRTLLLTLSIPATLLAQPTIHHMNDYVIGEKITTLDCNPKAPGTGGASVSWDFSTLIPLGSGSDTLYQWIIAPPTSPAIAGATFVTYDGQGSYDYFTKTAGSNFILGSYDSAGTTTSTFAHPLTAALRPVTMGSTFNDTLTVTILNSSMPPAQHLHYAVTALADGYGTLKLPNGTFTNVLRLKLSLLANGVVSFGPITDTVKQRNYSWQWFDDNHNSPLLSVDSSYSEIIGLGGSNDTSSSTQYLLKDHTTGVTPVPNSPVRFTAAIGKDGLTIGSEFISGVQYQLCMFTMSGQKVFENYFTASGHSAHLGMENSLASGIYIVTLMKDGDAGSLSTLKVLKQ